MPTGTLSVSPSENDLQSCQGNDLSVCVIRFGLRLGHPPGPLGAADDSKGYIRVPTELVAGYSDCSKLNLHRYVVQRADKCQPLTWNDASVSERRCSAVYSMFNVAL